ncbi:MAG: hypothetical protein ABR861_10580 [Terriglobales bacterium]
MTNKYRADLVVALNELLLMEAEFFEMEKRIAKQKKRIAALHELAEGNDEAPAPMGLVQGITDACRTVFRAADEPLYPIQVKERVEALGLPPQQNLLASVHTVIRRLVAANEIQEVSPIGGSGPLAYQLTALKRFAHAHKAKLAREQASKTPGQQIAELKAIRDRNK